MPWYVIFLFGIIVGGIIFNTKMRKGAMRILGGLMGEKTKKEKPGMVARVGDKRYKLTEIEEEEE